MHQTQDTYSLTHFRQKTQEHLDRIAGGAVETITQNGEAAIVVMSPARYDFLIHASERGHIWAEAIRRYEAGERGVEAGEAISRLAAKYGVEL